MEMKRIIVPFEVKQVEESDEFFTFKGFASTFGNVDEVDDIVEFGAFSETLRDKSSKGELFPALWQHRSDEPIGVFPIIREESKGLWVEGQLPKEDTFVSGRVMPQLRIGSVNKMSIGFSTWGIEGATETIDGIRRIKKLKLYEVSLVTFPANDKACVSEVKAMIAEAKNIEEFKKALLKISGVNQETVKSIMDFIGKSKPILINDFNSHSEKEFEELLHSGVSFSRKDSKAVLSAIKSEGLRDVDSTDHRDGVKDFSKLVDELKSINKTLKTGV